MTIFVVFFAAYVIILVLFNMTGLFPFRKNALNPKEMTVSIVVAARNEKDNISPCLESLVALDYPTDIIEIIVVDDLSTDQTAEIVTAYANRFPNIKLITSSNGRNTLVGKVRALAAGMAVATGEIILVTDADCRVPSTWVSEIVKYYENPKVGMVAGFTSISGTNMFSRVQALDWLTLVAFAAASARLGIPSTAVGNNLSFRRSAYERVGGYENIPFSVTEDLALVRAIVSETDYMLTFSRSVESMVTCAPCATWTEWYRQRTRWFIGGKSMSLTSKLIFLSGYLTSGGILYLFFTGNWVLPLIVLVTKTFLETTLSLPVLSRSSRVSLLLLVPIFQTYFVLYVLILPLLTLFRRTVSWKGRTFQER